MLSIRCRPDRGSIIVTCFLLPNCDVLIYSIGCRPYIGDFGKFPFEFNGLSA